MYYNDYQYKMFRKCVDEKKYFITELELREYKAVSYTKTIMATDNVHSEDFPPDHSVYYEIVIEYVQAAKPKEYLSEAFGFGHFESFEEIKAVYDEHLKLRVKK